MRSIAAGLGLLGLALAPQAPSDRISPDTVDRLAVAWTYDTRESTEPLRPGTDRPAFEATPVYADGRLYLSTPGGLVIALDAETGGEAWRVDLRIRRNADYSDFASRGVADTDGRIYAGTVDGRLVCLAARDGRFCDGFGVGGANTWSRITVDAVNGLVLLPTSSPSPDGAINLGGPVTTTNGLVFIGATLDPYLRAFDTRNGRQVWEARLPTSARATPLLFTTERGREMVAIAAGGHDTPLSTLGSTLVVFGLRNP